MYLCAKAQPQSHATWYIFLLDESKFYEIAIVWVLIGKQLKNMLKYIIHQNVIFAASKNRKWIYC
jgi:hypothetical protein